MVTMEFESLVRIFDQSIMAHFGGSYDKISYFLSLPFLYSTCLFISNLSVRVEFETLTVRAVMGAIYILTPTVT